MPRRPAVNSTQIPQIASVKAHDVYAAYTCIHCYFHNLVHIGSDTATVDDAYENFEWKCENCGYVHSKKSGLPAEGKENASTPFANWPEDSTLPGTLPVERFWRAFFRDAVGIKEDYWKQCKTCGRILPAKSFARHSGRGWGILQKQAECKGCKAVINTTLNPLRTKEQLHEAASRRRTGDMLTEGFSTPVNHADLFRRFGGKCFKTGKELNINDRDSWAIDHILPSKWLYPLNPQNAALLSTEANGQKSDKWPSEYYTNDELIRLSKLVGADLSLLSRKEPLVNSHIDVDACVSRMLTVRDATDLSRRIDDTCKLLGDLGLLDRLSSENKQLLGLAS